MIKRFYGRIGRQFLNISCLIGFSFILMLIPQNTHANNLVDSGETIRYPFWFTPSPVNRIYGLAIMPFGSGFIYNKPQAIAGLAIHGVGVGFFLPLVPQQIYDQFKGIADEGVVDSVASSQHNPTHTSLATVSGGLFSLTGTATYVLNGLSASLLSTAHGTLNGISVCPIYNRTFYLNGVTIGAVNDSFRVRGVQIGLFNSTYYLSGIQLGIINRNKKRITPLINWSMDK